jgi:oligosaccharide repeat unit polymerase
VIALYFILSSSLLVFGLLSIRHKPWAAPGRLLSLMVLFYGLVFKPLFVALSLPSEEFIDIFVLSPLTRSDYWSGSTALLGGYGLFVFAMVLTSKLLSRFRKPVSNSVKVYFSPRIAFVFLIISSFGIVIFLSLHPELLTGANKNILATDDLSSYSGDGIVRLLISFAYLLPFFMLLNIGGNYKRSASQKIFLLSTFSWLLFGVLSDQRGLILFSVLSWVVAYNCFVRSLQLKYLLWMFGTAISLVFIKTINRFGADGIGFVESANDVIGNYIGRNFVENSKSLIIINAIPNTLPFSYGASYLDSVLVLIPRSLFPSKLTVNLDTTIGNVVFDCNSFGSCAIPPGLLAESYLNFGWPWIFLTALMCGWMTAWLDWKSANKGQLFQLFYVSTLVFFGISVLGSGLASFFTQFILNALLLIFVWYALKIRRNDTSTKYPVIDKNFTYIY